MVNSHKLKLKSQLFIVLLKEGDKQIIIWSSSYLSKIPFSPSKQTVSNILAEGIITSLAKR